jgi:hypothetical protein
MFHWNKTMVEQICAVSGLFELKLSMVTHFSRLKLLLTKNILKCAFAFISTKSREDNASGRMVDTV